MIGSSTKENTMPTIFAYLRVSTTSHDQTTDNQKKMITDAGFGVDEWISEDGVSGSVDAINRPAFSRMMKMAKAGDTVICTMVDRLGRTASDVLNTVDRFKALGIRLRVMQFDAVDVTSPTGKMIVTVMAACAELEKNLLVERTVAGLARTREQGTILGAPLTVRPADLRAMCKARLEGKSFDKLALDFPYPRQTIYRNVKKYAEDLDGYEEEFIARQAQYAMAVAA